LVETVFSVLKRKFGEALKARKYSGQIKELKIKLILYNISKIIHFILIYICHEKFYRALFFKMLQNLFFRAKPIIFMMIGKL